jgi:S-formylglutathione hydrolase FrmB
MRRSRPRFRSLAFTKNPWGHAVMGCSSGGAAALTIGLVSPRLFPRIIAIPGPSWTSRTTTRRRKRNIPLGAWEYHSGMKLIEKSEQKPLRIFTHVSENDLRAKDPESTNHNWVMAGQRTSAALTAKGYHHRFVFSKATGHCDGKVFNQTLADTLVWVWRGYHE